MEDSQDNNQKQKRSGKGRRAGQIKKRGQDKYLLSVYLGRDSEGKRHYHNETFYGKKRDAEERLRLLLTKQKNHEPLRMDLDTLNKFIDEWLDARPDLKESTIDHYRNILGRYVGPKLGGRLLTQITAADVQALYKTLYEDDLSRVTVNHVHTLLKVVFKFAMRRRKISFNPMDGVDAPGGKNLVEEKREKREARVMTPEQANAFLAAAEAETRFGFLFTLAFFTGCRPGELLALRWEDFDQAERTLTIRHTLKWRSAEEWYLDKPKTISSRRTLRLTEGTIEQISQHRRRQLEDRMKYGKVWTDTGFIFTDELGLPYKQTHTRYQFKQILKAAGLPEHFSPYSARHTSATLLMASGVNPKTVSERLGHRDVRITLDAYTHPTDGMKDTAGETIERLIKGGK